MLALSIALALQGDNLPEHASFQFTGLPAVQSGGLHTQTCGVTVAATETSCDVTSQTVYKNPGEAGTATILIPRRRIGDEHSGNPNFALTATWDNKPVSLATHASRAGASIGNGLFSYESDLTAQVPLVKGGTHVLRIHCKTDVGKCGFDMKQKVVGYLLDGSDSIYGLNVSYPYGGKTVFRLPEVFPSDFEWQVGEHGAFARKPNFTPGNQLTYITFYPGGFKHIGDNKDGGGR